MATLLSLLEVSYMGMPVSSFSFLLTPALLGLVAGFAHGLVSHQADLPLSLAEQAQQVLQIE